MEDDDLTTPELDIDVCGAGGNIRCIATSQRGQRWFFGTCPEDLRRYFFYRAYGDTAFGWFDEQMDEGFDRLVVVMLKAGLRVRVMGSDLEPSDADAVLVSGGSVDDR